jgi:predicted RNase H-like HicB family nuclease
MRRLRTSDFLTTSAIEVVNRKAKTVKHLDKALIASGAALLLSGGIAAAALGPGNVASQVMASLPGDVSLAANNNMGIGGRGWLNTAATYIGVSEADLRTELATGKSLADVAVAHGKTRDGLIAALTQAATTEIQTLVDQKNPFPAPPAGVPGRGFRIEGQPFAAASTYLGITEADLRTKLQSGQTLAQIAAATAGKSRDGLIAALVADENTKIDQAQKDGKLTADQATQLKSNVTTRVTALVDGTMPAFPGGPGRGHRDFGPRPSASPTATP